uniref:Uncharacterized protein n=2 Tax=Anguilla anguilla TaxID=7936 RepID=A0A0E9R7N2_ANGAN
MYRTLLKFRAFYGMMEQHNMPPSSFFNCSTECVSTEDSSWRVLYLSHCAHFPLQSRRNMNSVRLKELAAGAGCAPFLYIAYGPYANT